MARMIYDEAAMSQLTAGILDADMYNETDMQELLYAGAKVFVAEAKAAAERAGHCRTGLMIDKIDYYRKVDKTGNGYSVSISVLGKDRARQRNAAKAFVLNYGRSKVYGFIPGSHFWNAAMFSAAPKITAATEKAYEEKLRQKGLI